MFPEGMPDLSALLGMLPPEMGQQLQGQLQQIEQQKAQALQQLQSTVTVEQIEELFKSQRLRPFVLDVETDSTIEPDQMAEKQARVEFSQAIAPLVQQGVMAMQMAPQLAPFVAESIRYLAGGFKTDRSMDEAIDALAEGFENYQPPQEPQEGDPESAKMEAEASMVKAQADAQKAQTEAQNAGQEVQLKQQELEFKQSEMKLATQKTGAEIQKIMAEIEKIKAEIGLKAEEVAVRKQEVGLKGQEVGLAAKKTDAEIERGRGELSLNEQKTKGELTLAERKLQTEASRGERQDGLAEKKVDFDAKAAGVRTKKKRVLTPEHDTKGRIKRIVETEED